MTVAAFGKLVRRMQELEERDGVPYAIVEMDCDESRRIYLVPLSYTYGDEFEAFSGQVIVTSEIGS